jgi:hypothetical protein
VRERDIEAYLIKQVKKFGGEVRKVQWVGRHGAPDRLVMLPAHPLRDGPFSNCRTIWVELKAPGVKPGYHQRREHERMADAGQVVVVIDSIEQVDGLLR